MRINFGTILKDRKEIEKISLELISYLDEIEKIENKAKKEKEFIFSEEFLFFSKYYLENGLKEYYEIFEAFKKLKNFLIIGIGGSNSIVSSIYGFLRQKSNKEVFFLNDSDNLILKASLEFIKNSYLNNNEVGIILITKSGKTLESLINFEIIKNKLKELDKDWKSKILVITDEDSPLINLSKENGYHFITFSQKTSGRFSVFSKANLFVLKVIGIDIDKLTQGAYQFLKESFLKDVELNSVVIISSYLYNYFLKNNFIYNIFLSNPLLGDFGYWYRQIIAESLGKNKKGLIPLISFFNKDLHSMYQLFTNAPCSILTNFIFLENLPFDYLIENVDFDIFKSLEGKSIEQVNKVVYLAVRESYLKLNLPFYEITLENFNEEEIGRIIQFKMMEVVLLAKLLKVNPFSQEAVENYKSEVRKNLKI